MKFQVSQGHNKESNKHFGSLYILKVWGHSENITGWVEAFEGGYSNFAICWRGGGGQI